tara:strand:- start:10949 stop:12304 length:1356 start_codon:yes stop_codon:yes gene_type:complete
MKPWHAKFGIVILLAGVLATYTQCVPQQGKNKSKLKYSDSSPSSTGNGNTGSGTGNTGGGTSTTPGLTSVQAFAQTTHAITKARCTNCHGGGQQPLHAVANAQQAHDAIVNSSKVNFGNPAQSRMVLKLTEGHNCWGDCNMNAQEMLDSVNDWVYLMQDTTTTTGSGDDLVTTESNTIAMVLDPNSTANVGDVMLNMEATMLAAPMVKGTEGGVEYIWVPNGTHAAVIANNNNIAGRATIMAQIPTAGRYKMFGLVRGYGDADDSFHIKIGNNNYTEWHVGGDTNGYRWVEVTSGSGRSAISYQLAAANHLVEIREREDGTKLSKLLLTDDLQLQASQLSGGPQATLSFSLNALAPGSNAQFRVDISIYDMYSYRITNPRIVLPSGTMRVKNVKPLVNGNWNPQHSTYTIVDKMVTPNDATLSGSSMIVLKDQGEVVDRLSFSFEMLEYTP